MTRRELAISASAAALSIAVWTSGCALLRGGGAADAAAERDAAETEAALAILERMSEYLASRDAFRFRAEIRYDAVQASGQRIEFGGERRVAVRRPDRLRVDVVRWDGASELVIYDGAHLSAAAPSLYVYASTDQTGPLDRALERFERETRAPTPLAELFDTGLYAKLAGLVESGARVGVVRIDGHPCDQLAFRTAGLDFQLFVERGDAALPRRLVIDYREEKGRPQFRASLREWEPAADLPDTLFRFAPPAGAQRIGFEELFDLLEGRTAWPVPSDERGAS